jgi:hypothetical protein
VKSSAAMSRLIQIAGVVVLGGFIAASASATEVTINPGVGIGRVKIGMTERQVEKELGRDFLVNERTTVRGSPYRELGWNFSSWSVGILRAGATWRVIQVATTVRSQRTLTSKIGAGSTFKSVIRAFPHVICGVHYAPPTAVQPPRYALLVAHKGGQQTVFWVGTASRSGVGIWRVTETTVRESFRPLDTFGPGHECGKDWRTSGHPY